MALLRVDPEESIKLFLLWNHKDIGLVCAKILPFLQKNHALL